MFKKSKVSVSLLRAIGVICSTLALMTSITYAALQSPAAALLNNSITSATADLRIGTSATSFAATRTGFSFNDLVPGGPALPIDGNIFYLKNYGSASLKLKIAISSLPANVSGVDLTKVSFVLTRVDTTSSQGFTLASLVDTYATGGLEVTDPISGGVVAQYKLQAIMAPDAFSGQSAAISDLDVVFTGTGLTN